MKRYDVAIIGSGAAGSVMAYKLAERGLSVIVLEKGMRQDSKTFEHSEYAMVPRLYKEGGLQSTADRDISILQGQTVGGSTVINNAIWMRSDLDSLLPLWRGLGANLEKAPLVEAFDDLERLLHVSEVPDDASNRPTAPFLKACSEIGIRARKLQNNRRACIACGWCNYGCRYDRKTSALVTFIPWAEAKGTEVLDGCADLRLVLVRDGVTGVEFTRRGRSETVTADRYVVSAGAIGSSAVLLKSGVNPLGRVGRNFHLLGGVVVSGEMNERMDGYDGIGLTCIADAADNPRSVIETFFSPPGAFALTLGGWFDDHAARMRRYAYYMQAGAMVGTAPHGKISLDRRGRTKIDLRMTKTEIDGIKAGIRTISRIFFRAGAKAVVPGTFHSMEFRSENDFRRLDGVRTQNDLLVGSAHPQGGNTISDDPARGVVDSHFKVHGLSNLYVADASVLPTNIWVNCQATVMALAHYASRSVAA